MYDFKLFNDDSGMGMQYLDRLMPDSCHASAAYSGVSYVNTVRMLNFDLADGSVLKEVKVDGMTRLAATDGKGRLVGAAVSYYLPQFSSVLDYEQYIVAAGDSKEIFFSLINSIRNDSPCCEIITFRQNERDYIEDSDMMAGCHDIHYWTLYEISPSYRSSNVTTADSLPDLPHSEVSIEATPQRYAEFMKAGLSEYRVMTDGDKYASVCSILPYCTAYKEMKLWYADDADAKAVAELMQTVVYLHESAIWRIKAHTPAEKAIIEAGGFQPIGKEAHYHFDFSK